MRETFFFSVTELWMVSCSFKFYINVHACILHYKEIISEFNLSSYVVIENLKISATVKLKYFINWSKQIKITSKFSDFRYLMLEQVTWSWIFYLFLILQNITTLMQIWYERGRYWYFDTLTGKKVFYFSLKSYLKLLNI